jgi:threonine synthase
MADPDLTPFEGSAPLSEAWNPRARLHCLECDATFELAPMLNGCPICDEQGASAPLEVVYVDTASAGPQSCDLKEVLSWLVQTRQPLNAGWTVTLGRTATPLVGIASFGTNVYVKNESTNPTWGHKDRLHEVAVGAAQAFRRRGIVASSTGNHGAAAAAHAAAGGLPSVVFCHPQASPVALQMIAAYGGIVAQFDPSGQRGALISLVDDGWFPATSMDPLVSGRANPFGAEGYKAIAYEVAGSLGHLPDIVIVPTASGDTFYGVAKGFAEIAAYTHEPMPRLVAAQPEAANPLQQSLNNGKFTRVNDPHSIALSVADGASGRQALFAARQWNGSAVSVSDNAIVQAFRDFAAAGLLVEPASALPLAAYRTMLETKTVHDADVVVLLATSAAIKWPSVMADIFPVSPVGSSNDLDRALQGLGLLTPDY